MEQVDINAHKIITAELSALNMTDSKVLSNLLKQIYQILTQYQLIVLTIPDNITKPLVLN
ncbi:hypothetical protein [Candidatus Enterovibrio altilux]